MDQQEGTFKLCGKRCILHPAGFFLCAEAVVEFCVKADRLYVLKDIKCWIGSNMVMQQELWKDLSLEAGNIITLKVKALQMDMFI